MVRALPVELEELDGILEGDPLTAGGRIDIVTGEVWPQAAIDYAVEIGEEDEDSADDLDQWLPVPGEGYRDMELFIAFVEDPDRVERLAIAIVGRGAFRRFKDELSRWPVSSSDGTHCPRSASAASCSSVEVVSTTIGIRRNESSALISASASLEQMILGPGASVGSW